jgi:hypothetical protein
MLSASVHAQQQVLHFSKQLSGRCNLPSKFDLYASLADYHKRPFVRNAANWCLVRIADLYSNRSESPVSALHVEMCMVQHLLLSALGVE